MHRSAALVSVCTRLNVAEVDGLNYGLSFKINMKPLRWFMQPGSWAIETSKTSMSQCWEAETIQSAGFCCEKAWEMPKWALPSSTDFRQNTGWKKIHCERLEKATKPTAGPMPNRWAELHRETSGFECPTALLSFTSHCAQQNKLW